MIGPVACSVTLGDFVVSFQFLNPAAILFHHLLALKIFVPCLYLWQCQQEGGFSAEVLLVNLPAAARLSSLPGERN